jgi:hypothetical protein
VNFLGDEGADRVKEAYEEDKYRKLVVLKNKYDPRTSPTSTRTSNPPDPRNEQHNFPMYESPENAPHQWRFTLESILGGA